MAALVAMGRLPFKPVRQGLLSRLSGISDVLDTVGIRSDFLSKTEISGILLRIGLSSFLCGLTLFNLSCSLMASLSAE